MKGAFCRIFLGAWFVSAASAAFGQTNVYTNNIIGYVNYVFRSGGSFQSGDTLFGNPLHTVHDYLSEAIPRASDGTTVWLWNASTSNYTQSSIFSAGAWSVNLALPPGQGALLRTFVTFTNTFVGEVLSPDGSPLNPDVPIVPPPPFDRPSGVYLLSSKFPAGLSSSSWPVFDYILGRPPREGEQFTRLDPITQTYYTTTFLSGIWNNGDPELPVGEAAFFSVVPEPSVLALLGLFLTGIVTHLWKRRV